MAPLLALLLLSFGLGLVVLVCWVRFGIRQTGSVLACFLPVLVATVQAAILATGTSLSVRQVSLPLEVAALFSLSFTLATAIQNLSKNIDSQDRTTAILANAVSMTFGLALVQAGLVVLLLALGFSLGGGDW